MHQCLTCKSKFPSRREVDRHVIDRHLPDDWIEADLEGTSEKVSVSSQGLR